MGNEETPSNLPAAVLHPAATDRPWTLVQRAPAGDLAWLVEHYWIVRWDLSGRPPYLQETLPHPSVHLVLMRGGTGVFGVMRGKFAITLDGVGTVFGIRLKPGAFFPFLRGPVSGMTDQLASFREMFDVDDRTLMNHVLGAESDDEMVARGEAFLRERMPEHDENVLLVSDIVALITRDSDLLRVDSLAERVGLSERALQRLFLNYVGVGPKWVIRRSRLHEAARQLASGMPFEGMAALAQSLGYFDQAHFNHDFKAIIGKAPAHYAADCARGTGAAG